MKCAYLQTTVMAALLWLSVTTTQAQFLDQIGVTALRAVTTNLNGSGIRVGQAEAYNGDNGSTNAWEVNPANVGQPVSLFTYTSALGTSTNFTNSVGTWSSHADAVGNNFYGLPNGVATNVVHVDNYDANDYVELGTDIHGNWICLLPAANPAEMVVNQSFIYAYVPSQIPVAAQQAMDSEYDNYSATNHTLFVAAAGNGGGVCPPSTCYNGLSVGVYNGGSSVGPTADNGRCKPDLTTSGYPGGYTSFSTPYVSGAAAVLMQAALRGDGGSDTNAAFDLRTIKALLLNGAVKPADWTNSSSSPLDARYGAGVLNVLNSYGQLAGGRQSNCVTTTVVLNSAHLPTGATNTISALSGWDFGTNTSSATLDAIKHYYFNVTNGVSGAKFIATATLVWHRHLNKTNINNLDLFLFNCANSNRVLCSTSLVDNVEHIYTSSLPAGRYDLQVGKAGGATVTTNEVYALAWAFVSPTLNLSKTSTNALLSWPVYPAGFLVEAATDLTTPSWITNTLPAATITNSRNSLTLNATNAAQFFRLRAPNF
jgi:hypothetical protein